VLRPRSFTGQAAPNTKNAMRTPSSQRHHRAPSPPHMTQPEGMKTECYVYGVEKLNGYDAWALFEACAQGDTPKVKALLAKDGRLVNAQFWYQFPIHMAVRAGHAEIVKLLLDRGADPGQSRYTYNSWDKLLRAARERGHRRIESLLQQAMRKRFNYTPAFEVLKEAIVARDARKIGAVLRRQPDLARASDALGNNALHWSVITRQLGWIARFVELGTPIDAERADGQTPVLLAITGIVPRAESRILRFETLPCWLATCLPRERVTRFLWRPPSAIRNGSSNCWTRMPDWPGAWTRRASVRCPMRRGQAICTLSACCWNTARTQTRPKT